MGRSLKLRTVNFGDLARGYVLSPQRYERDEDGTGSQVIGDVASIVRTSVSAKKAADLGSILVLDTSHVRNGLIDSDQARADSSKMGSTKKLVQVGDVIVSRLRPYLKQIAYVDEGASPGAALCVSTEFYVIRGKNGVSIAYMIPWLLSDRIQGILANSQEGGHHPRVNEEVVLSLPLPDELLEQHEKLSQDVSSAISLFRQSKGLLRDARALAEEAGLSAISRSRQILT